MNKGIIQLIFFCLLVFAFANCDEEEKPVRPPKEKFDAIEKIFGNENWQTVNGKDTVYFYFSRTGDVNTNVYLFNMIKGDSSGTAIAKIFSLENHVYWNWGGVKVLLVSTSDTAIKWVNPINGKDYYTFKKTDSSHILFFVPLGPKVLTMQKTLPLATFLARARYDYEHGTSFVDSPLVNAKH